MDDNAIQAKKCRERAAQMRVIAEDIRGDDRRRLLLKVAQDYNRVALQLEAIATAASRAARRSRRSG
jgi:hypothetical protein